MAHQSIDQENQVPQNVVPRFGLKRENGQQKNVLTAVSRNAANIKRVQPVRQVKKATGFTVFDENASDAVLQKKENIWAPGPVQQYKTQPVNQDLGTKHSFKCDGQPKLQRQPLAPLGACVEDSPCSSSSMNISLHQSDFVFSTHHSNNEEKVHGLSPMAIDSCPKEDGEALTFSEHAWYLECGLPEAYLDDIYNYLRNCEERHRPKPHYMRKQADITPGMRSILIDWLVEVAEEYKLHNETLYLAVSFIDRFLSHMSVLRGKLQLVGTAAMFIAAKYEEIYPPEVGEFVYITDDTYTKKQVLRMEHLILKVLAFEIAVPTPHYFLQRFVQLSRSDEITLHLATYLCELTLLETEPYLHHLPSEIAAACLALSRLASGHELWPSHLSITTGYTLEHLIPCIKYLHSSWSQAPANPQQAIREKYKTEKWHAVSLLTPPPLSTLDLAQI